MTLLAAALTTAATSPALAQTTTLTQIAEYQIAEANQGVGVDEHFFYPVDDRKIAKYSKQTGKLVAKWEGAADGPIIHLDSAAVVDGKIYASHSNYRFFPMTSSIEVWDARTMKHIASHSIGIRLGSLTWLDKHDGHWWGTFANYDRTGRNPDGSNSPLPYGGKINTTLVKFDKNWGVLKAWIFPLALLNKFADMSNSGGSWGPDGRLYLTGHDPAEVYKIRFPSAGSILEVEEIIPANIRGQGIAWDPARPGVLYGIIRATSAEQAAGQTHRVVVFQSNLKPRKRDWHRSRDDGADVRDRDHERGRAEGEGADDVDP
jgi:hypothetical protein